MNPLAALIASLTGASAAGGRGAQQTQSSESGLFAQLLGTEGGLTVTATGETAEAGQADPAGLVAVPDGSAAGSSPVTAHFAALVAAEGETVPLAGTDAVEGETVPLAGTEAVEGEVASAEVPAEPTPDAPEETEAETVLPDVVELVSDDAEGTPGAPVPEQESAETDTPTGDDETPGDDGATPAVQPAPHATGLENAPQKAGDGPGAKGLERAVARAGDAPGQTWTSPIHPHPAAAGTSSAPAQDIAPQATARTTNSNAGGKQGQTGESIGKAYPTAGASENADGPRRPVSVPTRGGVRGREGADIARPDRILSTAVNPATGQTLIQIREGKETDSKGLVTLDPGTTSVQLRAGPAAPAPASTQPPQIPVNALAVHIAQQAQNGARRFDIRLDPPELGRVEIRLDVTRDGHVTTHLVVERSETLDLLQRDARQLERALQNAGLDTSEGEMKFSLKDHGLAQDMQQEGHSASGGGGTGNAENDDVPDQSIEPHQYDRHYMARDGLDIRI